MSTVHDICARVDEHIAELIGSGPQGNEANLELEQLQEHIAECDRCRDLRYATERVHVSDAAADYRHPEDLESKLLAALDARKSEPASATRTAPAQTIPAEPASQKLGHLARGLVAHDASRATTKGDHSTAVSRATWLRRPRNTLAVGLLAAAASAAGVWMWPATRGSQTQASATKPWTGKVAKISRAAGGEGGLQLCSASGCTAATTGAAIAKGTTLRTDDRTRAYVELEDGTRVALDRSSELVLDDADRTASLKQGALVADVAHVKDSNATIRLPHGRVAVLGTKLAVRLMGDAAAVDVSRGSVELFDERDRSVRVRAGEEGRVYPGSAPYAAAATSLGDALSWSEGEESGASIRGLGELKAKKPGSDDERSGVVHLARHRAKIRIVDGFARTEIDETFSNSSDDVLEGIYRFPLPPDAQIERLALEVDGKMEEGAFVDRDRAMAIWRGAIVNSAPNRPKPREEIIWVPGPWKDPALLEWQRGGRFELRIFPIPKKGSRRVVLTYTQVVAPTGGVRRYLYPLPHDPKGSLTVDDFAVEVEVRGHDKKLGVGAQGYTMAHESRGDADALRLDKRGFVPSGDLVIEYAAAERERELTAWAFSAPAAPITASTEKNAPKDEKKNDKKSDGDKAVASLAPNDFVAISLRPKLPRKTDESQRAFALVVDSSRSMFGERYRRAVELAANLAAELDPLDRFTVIACDTTCRSMGELRAPSQSAARETLDFLKAITPEGASDPTAAMREAAAIASKGEGLEPRIVYIGDGMPTVGPVLPSLLTAAIKKSVPAHATITAVALGNDADTDALSAMARAGNGVVLPYAPGRASREMAFAVLGAALGSGLSEITVELPAGLTEVTPRQLDTIPAGGEAWIAARMREPRVKGTVVLRGKVGKTAFEQRYPLEVEATGSSGNAFVPRLFAGLRINDLQRDSNADARTEAIALSSRFNVASRHTSLLVLESAAMFKAFGLDNSRSVAEWTGEERTTESASADGENAVADEKSGDKNADLAEGEAKKEKTAARASAGASKDRAPSGDFGGDGFSSPPGATPPSQPAPMASAAPMMPPPPPPASSTTNGRFDDDSMDAAKQDRRGAPQKKPTLARPRLSPRDRGRTFIPMRVVWERMSTIGLGTPASAGSASIRKAEDELAQDENKRANVKKLFALYQLAGDVDRAEQLAKRWSEKEPLDPEALTARADVAARKGDRELAIRILGSVLDVRADDVQAQRRLARLHRWSGATEQACRFSMAAAQMKRGDVAVLGEAVRCARQQGDADLVRALLDTADTRVRDRADRGDGIVEDPTTVRGELQITATWQGNADVDVALIHPDGLRISWLGAPTQELISATDATARGRESLGVLGSKAGDYAIEVVRARGEGPIRGELKIVAPGGSVRTIPFTLEGQRIIVGSLNVRWEKRLERAWDVPIPR